MRTCVMALVAIGLGLGAAWAGESVDDRLGRAFPGDDGPIRAPIRIVSADQGVIVTGQYLTLSPDTGQVRLTDCYVFRTPAEPGPASRPVAARARSVVLTYDAPVRRMEDLRGRKLVWASADLDAGVRLDLTRR